MKSLIFVLCSTIALHVSVSFADQKAFPMGPESQVTPGSLCKNPSARRYPEQIAYCNRSVDSGVKNDVIETYERQFGYEIRKTGRSNFKIDHLIPLCAGGSNDPSNLWPQHQSVYAITDPLEPEICDKMSMGKLKQEDAIKLVLQAKHDLSQVSKILAYVRGL